METTLNQKQGKDLQKRKKHLPRANSQPEFDLQLDKNDLGYPLMRHTNLNEFLGFNLETKVRELVLECVDPLRQKQLHTEKRVKEAEERVKNAHKEINQLGFVIQKTLQRSSSLEEVHQQILLMENERKVSESSLITELATLRQMHRENQEKLQAVDELSNQYIKKHELFRGDLNTFRNDLSTFKDHLTNDHIHFKSEFTQKHDRFYADIQKLQESMNINTSRINNHLESLKSHEALLHTYKNNLNELYETVEDLNEKKMGKDSYEQELRQIRRDLFAFKKMSEDTYNSIQMTDNYIDSYLKVEMANEVIEGLFQCMTDSDTIERIIEYSRVKYFGLQNMINERESQFQEDEKIKCSFNKVGYKIPKLEKKIDSEACSYSLVFESQNGPTSQDIPIHRPAKELDQFKRKVLLTQKALLQKSNTFSPNSRHLSRKNSKTPNDFETVQEEKEEMNDIDGVIDTPILFLERSQPETPRSGSIRRTRGAPKRPQFKKIIVNSTSQAQVRQIIELKEQNEVINSELKQSDQKHFTHTQKIAVLEDLDDELKEIVLQSSEQIEDIYKKLEKLKKGEQQLIIQVESEDNRILQRTEESIKEISQFIKNMQADFEEDLKRRIKEKSNIALVLKQLTQDLEEEKELGKKHDDTLIMIMESLGIIIQNSRILTKLIQQDEIDKQSMQLLGIKMNNNSNEQIKTNPIKKGKQANVNSVLTGLSNSDLMEDQFVNSQLSMSSNPQKPIITIDKNCFSCSGQQQLVLNAFKIACLQYQPQRVLFNSDLYERSALIDMSLQKLESLNKTTFVKQLNELGMNIYFNQIEQKSNKSLLRDQNEKNDASTSLFGRAEP